MNNDHAIETIKRIAAASPFSQYNVTCPACGHMQPHGCTCERCQTSIAHAPSCHAEPVANQEQRPL